MNANTVSNEELVLPETLVQPKVIVLDLDHITPDYVLAIAAVVLSLGLSYRLVSQKS